MQPIKNKKLTILLLCTVAAVWGIIIYRVIYKEDGGPPPISAKAKFTNEPIDEYFVKEDTNKLVLSYRDPFLGKVYKEPGLAQSKPNLPSTALVVKPEPIPVTWPGIQYSGFIINPASKKVVSIVSVNGKERMISEGETFESVTLVKNKSDSILVEWQGNRKYIKQ